MLLCLGPLEYCISECQIRLQVGMQWIQSLHSGSSRRPITKKPPTGVSISQFVEVLRQCPSGGNLVDSEIKVCARGIMGNIQDMYAKTKAIVKNTNSCPIITCVHQCSCFA